jgi:hypothetical protein
MPSSRLRGKEQGQQVQFVCFSRIFTEIWHVGNYVCRNMVCLRLAWVAVFASTPPPIPPDWVVHMCAPFGLHGTDVERLHIDEHGRCILYVGNGCVQFFACKWWGGIMVSPPSHRLSRAHTLPSAHTRIKIQFQF